MERNVLRSRVQEETVDKWANLNYSGYALISMGVGKTRLMALAIKRYLADHPEFDYKKYDFPVVVLVNSTSLRDKGIPDELKKWGVNIKVKIVCYQTAYRWNKKIGLLLADELDFAITEGARYLQVFNKCSYDAWLGLTGTMIKSKREVAQELFGSDPFYKFTLADSQLMGLVNKTSIWIHEVPLYVSSTPTAPYGEVALYKWVDNIISDCKSKISSIYDSLSYNPTFDEELRLKDILRKLKKKKEYWESTRSNPNNRLTVLHTLTSLSEYAKKLKSVILSQEGNKVIIFAELITEVDKVSYFGYHGKKSDDSIIDKLNSGEIRELGVVRKVNRGLNFVGLNNAIVHTFTSSVTNAMQAYIGRMVRLDPSKVANVHFLISYYYDDNNEKVYCHNYNWLQSILSDENLTHIEINYFDGIQLLK